MRVLGVITARGGSKGIHKKNLAPLLGKPLLEYTVAAARASRTLNHVVLSTDDEEIAGVGRNLGVEVPFLRPADLAQDDTPTVPVLQHTVEFLESAGLFFDAVFTLQPTNPLRLPEDIDGAVKLLEESGADSVIGFTEVSDGHPARMKTIDQSGRVCDPPFAEEFAGQPRQQLADYYLRIGSVYVTLRDVLMQQNSIAGTECRAWFIPPERAINVDTPLDLVIVECLLRRLKEENLR